MVAFGRSSNEDDKEVLYLIEYSSIISNQQEGELPQSESCFQKAVRYWKKSFFHKHLGIFLGVTEGFLFGCAQIAIQLGLDDSSHAIQSLFVRSCFELVFIIFTIVAFFRQAETMRGAPNERLFAILLGVFYTSTQIFIYLSMSKTSPLNTTVLLKSNILTSICAWLILKERLTFVDIVMLVLSICGVVLTCQPNFLINKSSAHSDKNREWFNVILGIVFGLLASIFLTMSFIVNRKIINSRSMFVSWIQTLICVLSTGIYTFGFCDFKFPRKFAYYGFAMLVAGFSFLGHWALIRGLQIEKATYVGVATTFELPTVFVLQIVILQNIPNLPSIFGAIIITVAIIGLSVRVELQDKLKQLCERLRDSILKWWHGRRIPEREFSSLDTT